MANIMLRKMPGEGENDSMQGQSPHGNENENILESLVLSVAHYWSCRETWDRQVELLDRNFRQDKMLHAFTDLCRMKMLEKPKKQRYIKNKNFN